MTRQLKLAYTCSCDDSYHIVCMRRRGVGLLPMEDKRCQNALLTPCPMTCDMPQAAAELADKEREGLEVIKEDLCQWLSAVLKAQITPGAFLECLDTGVLLCRLTKLIQEASRVSKNSKLKILAKSVKCNERATKESFAARDNASNFIAWCRDLGVQEAVVFESEGLVLHKDEKRVILCLLDVARFAERVGIPPPQLVRMEKEIETMEATTSKPQKNSKVKDSEKSLEERVMSKVKECICTQTSSPLTVNACGNGKFVIRGGRIRGDKTLHARLLSDRIMVRVGGGWDTLEHFLLEHDPCRIERFISEGGFQGKVIVGSESKSRPTPHHIIHH